MRDPRRLQERTEVKLERMQLVWLTLGVVVALGLSFALGMLVGKRAERLAAPAAATVEPLAQVDADGALHHELTFYSRLTSPTPARTAGGKAPAPAPAAEVKPAAPAPDPASAPALATAAPTTPVPTVAARPTETPTTVSVSTPTPAAPTGVEAEVLAELTRGPAHKGEFTVQVSSFQTADEARAYASSLERKGYKPFVVAGKVKGKGTWYRVRIGTFKDAAHAQSAKNLLARNDIPAWILRSE
jgi:DedD protein